MSDKQALRVVVVDDHDDLRVLVTMLLGADERFNVVGEGSNGHEAIKLVEEANPDLMLLDLAMPDMDGLEVLDVCQARWPGFPVIVVLSGFTALTMQASVLERGAAGYLEKGASFGKNVADDLYSAWSSRVAMQR